MCVCVCVCVLVCPPPPEDEQKEKSLSHHTIQALIIEKDQALSDLNSVEKSLAELFRRYEKMKDVLEGFRKVHTRMHAHAHAHAVARTPGNRRTLMYNHTR